MWGLGVPADLTQFLYEYVRPRREGEWQRAARGDAIHARRNSTSLVAGGAGGAGESGATTGGAPSSGAQGSAGPDPVLLIAHRGNVDGINKARENQPAYLM